MTDNQKQPEESSLQEISRLQDTIADLERKLQERVPEEKNKVPLHSHQKPLSDFAAFAVENMSDGVFLIAKDARIIYVNPAACRQLGYTKEELCRMRIMDINPHVKEETWKSAWDVTVSNKIQTIETEHLTKDGRILPVEVLANYVELNGEQYSCSFTRDITERKRAEETLRENEERYRLLFNLESDAIVVIDVETMKNLDVNQAATDLYGYSREELLSLKAPDLSAEPEETKDRILHDDGYVHIPLRWHRKKDGTVFPVDITARFFTFRGKPLLITAMRNIAERKAAEEALKVSEEKYRLVVENAHDAIFIVQNERIKFPNRQMTTISGYTEDELSCLPFFSFIHAGDKDTVKDRHRRRLQGEDVPATYSFRMINKSGETIWVEASVMLVTWEGSFAALVFLRDITMQKKLEEQLSQAQKMEAIGTLAGGIAHDFNNLLMGILGYTSLMLLQTEKPHPFYERLKTIEGLVESGAELTKQLLGFARGGKYEVKPVDVNALILKTSDIFGRTKKEVLVHKKLREDLYAVEADAGQIEQVLMNLYVNAWQAMPSGGSLFLETQNVILDELQSSTLNVHPGAYVKMSVTDTGVGMDSETQQRIYEPFFTTKGLGKGTGLGLASAYGIIKNHGGIISVYSEKGHGTTFTIYLPASGAMTDDAKPREGGLAAGHETILIVDDEPINIETIRELLEMLGYRIMTAQSGREAVELYRKHIGKVQLVILDMVMPGMNGRETLEKLMEMDREVCVLLSSGYSLNGEAKSILDLGCKGFIQKPFRVEELSQKVRELLDS